MIRQRAPVVHTAVDFILSSCKRMGLINGSRRPAVFTTVAVSALFAAGFAALAFASVFFAAAFEALGCTIGAAAFFGAGAACFTVCDAGLLACISFVEVGALDFVTGAVVVDALPAEGFTAGAVVGF